MCNCTFLIYNQNRFILSKAYTKNDYKINCTFNYGTRILPKHNSLHTQIINKNNDRVCVFGNMLYTPASSLHHRV